MHYKSNKLFYVALEFGCKTAKDFAAFLRKYNPQIVERKNGTEMVQFSLLR